MDASVLSGVLRERVDRVTSRVVGPSVSDMDMISAYCHCHHCEARVVDDIPAFVAAATDAKSFLLDISALLDAHIQACHAGAAIPAESPAAPGGCLQAPDFEDLKRQVLQLEAEGRSHMLVPLVAYSEDDWDECMLGQNVEVDWKEAMAMVMEAGHWLSARGHHPILIWITGDELTDWLAQHGVQNSVQSRYSLAFDKFLALSDGARDEVDGLDVD